MAGNLVQFIEQAYQLYCKYYTCVIGQKYYLFDQSRVNIVSYFPQFQHCTIMFQSLNLVILYCLNENGLLSVNGYKNSK